MLLILFTLNGGLIIMNILSNVHSVNGHLYRDIDIVDEVTGLPIDIINEVKTPHCGWVPDHICSRGCDIDCRNAQNLFDEIGIDY